MNGVYNVGDIKKTYNQEKKHVSQMEEYEIVYLAEKLKAIKISHIKMSNHLFSKQKELDFNMDDILNSMKRSDIETLIVEYNKTPVRENYCDYRVLIRTDEERMIDFKTREGRSFTALANMCFVISIKTSQIVTLYWNIQDDSHKTMNWNRYNENLRIID